MARSLAETLRAAPKVELHVHLDGSFDTQTLFDAARKHMAELPEENITPWDGKTLKIRSELAKCKDAQEFGQLVNPGPEPKGLFYMLDCFYRFLPIVRGRMEIIEELAYQFRNKQAADNIIYTEVRYSPHEFLVLDSDGAPVPGLTALDAVTAVCRGLRRSEKESPGVVVKQLLCCINMRPSWSAETVELAIQFQTEGVVGVDIASGEQHFDKDGPLHGAHREAMVAAHAAGLNVTVHSSEVGDPEHVQIAIDEYGATRVGHGYGCLGTASYATARARGTHFEVCPTSSIATKGVGAFAGHPLKQLLADRTSCSVSTDDPVVFGVSLSEELTKCVELIGVTLEDVEWMTLEGLRAAFQLASPERVKLEARVRSYYDVVLGRSALASPSPSPGMGFFRILAAFVAVVALVMAARSRR